MQMRMRKIGLTVLLTAAVILLAGVNPLIVGGNLQGTLAGALFADGNVIYLDSSRDNYITGANPAVIDFFVDNALVLRLQNTLIYISKNITLQGFGLRDIGGRVDFDTDTIPADDTTPYVGAGVMFFTSDNTVPTAITDLDNIVANQVVWICIGGTGANASTIADAGNFNIQGAWTPGLGDCIGLFARADNDYIEFTRSDN